jgi:hypothetical protein
VRSASLDLGGASLEIAYAVNSSGGAAHALLPDTVQLHVLDKRYLVFAKSFPEEGSNDFRNRLRQAALESNSSAAVTRSGGGLVLRDACRARDAAPIAVPLLGQTVTVTGAADALRCREQTRELLNVSTGCPSTCSVRNSNLPAFPPAMQFYATSGFYWCVRICFALLVGWEGGRGRGDMPPPPVSTGSALRAGMLWLQDLVRVRDEPAGRLGCALAKGPLGLQHDHDRSGSTLSPHGESHAPGRGVGQLWGGRIGARLWLLLCRTPAAGWSTCISC